MSRHFFHALFPGTPRRYRKYTVSASETILFLTWVHILSQMHHIFHFNIMEMIYG